MVTAELAVALTALVLVLGLAMNAIVAGIDLIRCTDAARVAARAAARGDDPASVRSVATDTSPRGSTVAVSEGERVRVVVRAPVRGPLAALLPHDLEADAVALREQTDEP